MEHSRQPAGPETAWYWERLRTRHRSQRIAGIAIFVFGLCLLIAEPLLTPDYNQLTILVLILIALLPVLQGSSLLLANRGPVTPQAVERLRSQERIQLFRQAQGTMLPWQYRRWTRILECILGLLLLLSIVQGALAALRMSQVEFSTLSEKVIAWVFVTLFALISLLLIIDSIYLKPRRARRFAKHSSAELAYRLSLGELVTSNPSKLGQ